MFSVFAATPVRVDETATSDNDLTVTVTVKEICRYADYMFEVSFMVIDDKGTVQREDEPKTATNVIPGEPHYFHANTSILKRGQKYCYTVSLIGNRTLYSKPDVFCRSISCSYLSL